MLTRYLSLGISAAAQLKRPTAHSSDRVRKPRSTDEKRDLGSGIWPINPGLIYVMNSTTAEHLEAKTTLNTKEKTSRRIHKKIVVIHQQRESELI